MPHLVSRPSFHVNNTVASTQDNADIPKEKPVDYSKLLERVKYNMNWYGRHHAAGDERQSTISIEVAIRNVNNLITLASNLDNLTNRSFATRVHIITIMLANSEAATLGGGLQLARCCCNSAYRCDEILTQALEKLSDAQRFKTA